VLASGVRSGSRRQAPGASRARPALLSPIRESIARPLFLGREKKIRHTRLRVETRPIPESVFRDASNVTTGHLNARSPRDASHRARAPHRLRIPEHRPPLSVFITMSSPDVEGGARPEVPSRSMNMVRSTKYSAESPYNDSPGTSPAPRAPFDERNR
jgi:hypothetical protein